VVDIGTHLWAVVHSGEQCFCSVKIGKLAVVDTNAHWWTGVVNSSAHCFEGCNLSRICTEIVIVV